MNKEDIAGLLNDRILVLDGSMGTMVQAIGLDEQDFRGQRFWSHPVNLKGNIDILNLSTPERIKAVHRAYLAAGADIITTNTFNSQAISQHRYGTDSLVSELNLAGARLAREVADQFTDRPRFVAGSIGPTGVSLCMNPEEETFDTLRAAYRKQMLALAEGGVDLLLIETVFDGINLKAALDATEGLNLPVMVSFTLSEATGRLMTGQTPEAILTAIAHWHPLAVGFNCSAGPEGLKGPIMHLAGVSPFPTILYPNAGLPDTLGHYPLTPQKMAREIGEMAKQGSLNIVGGCCGTTPEHIRLISKEVAALTPRIVPKFPVRSAWLSGTDVLSTPGGAFINIGERCNVAGSRRFLRLIKEGDIDSSVTIARQQVTDGAMILDINMDDPMVDAKLCMARFLDAMNADPVCASVPWMIDSSDFEVIEEALKHIQGKPIVNSISLRDGEQNFINCARRCLRAGAAVVVMAFDETGQATTFDRKVQICQRAYDILVNEVKYPPEDIIFDPNILTVGTGISDHERYGIDYIEAVRWIKSNLPGAKTSGGLSNLSFAFRGHNALRESMHAVMIYHARKAGLDMAIVNPGTKVMYDDIAPDLLEAIEDVILARRADATGRLVQLIAKGPEQYSTEPRKISQNARDERNTDQRLKDALRTGDTSRLEDDLKEAIREYGSASAIINGPLMEGMKAVGELFGMGKMFLPQVIKSARTMSQAVALLSPQMEKETSINFQTKAKILVATVRGDVHDIGKNIASIVMRCNGYEVVDLGVMVEPEDILSAIEKENPAAVGLSGLIAPSLGEMESVLRLMHQKGIAVPVLVGGATTSELHTAVRLAPAYKSGLVIRVGDASQNAVVLSEILGDKNEEYRTKVLTEQELLRIRYIQKTAEKDKMNFVSRTSVADKPAPCPSFLGIKTFSEISLSEVRGFINWRYFYNFWRLKPGTREAFEEQRTAEELLDVLERHHVTMEAQVSFAQSKRQGDQIVTSDGLKIKTPRQPSGDRLALCDYVSSTKEDYIGAFAVTTSQDLRNQINRYSKDKDDYAFILMRSLADRLAEATAEWLHLQVRTQLWGYAPDENLSLRDIFQCRYCGIRPAAGYPSLPDQKVIFSIAKMLRLEEIGVTLTQNGALNPPSSVCGLMIAHPDAGYFTVGG